MAPTRKRPLEGALRAFLRFWKWRPPVPKSTQSKKGESPKPWVQELVDSLNREVLREQEKESKLPPEVQEQRKELTPPNAR